MKSFAPCKLCHKAPASCRAHIIPQQFYTRVRGEEKHLLVLAVEQEVQKGFTQSGIWEQGILCAECDGRLGKLDEYAYEVLPAAIKAGKTRYLAPGATVVDMGIIDTLRFKRFLVSLVWRASHSQHELFRRVKIGPLRRQLNAILTGKDETWLRHVDCAFVFFDPPRYDKLLFPPHPSKCDEIEVMQFYLYPWKLLIKLDTRPFGPVWQTLSLKDSAVTYGLVMNDFSRGETLLLADLQKKIKAHEASRKTRPRTR